MGRTKPPWLKVKAPGGQRYTRIKARARQLNLHTVCEEAQCPNIGECWGGGTATFMVMGDTCTRGCRFCAVNTQKIGGPLDPDEPIKLASVIAEMQLDYVVLTSVNRDDLSDQGSGHFAACIKAIRKENPNILVETLVPDFCGRLDLLDNVLEAEPNVLAHNIECVRRLTPKVRDRRAGYDQSLQVLLGVKANNPSRLSKSSIMIGVGEKEEEVIETMGDLRAVGVDFLTLGQYLQPTKKHMEVVEFVKPEIFQRYQEIGEGLGFSYVASGPLVRSSYRAGEFYIKKHIENKAAS